MDYQALIERIHQETKVLYTGGKVANYIPALANVKPDYYGISLTTTDGNHIHTGDFSIPFSIQSISKIFGFTIVYRMIGERIWERIDKDLSVTAFNSLIQLEYERGIPRNPFINAGAIVVADLLFSLFENPLEELLSFVRKLSNDNNIYFNSVVASSERKTGHRNFALAHFMKSFGNIKNDVDEILEIYFNQCSIEMSTAQLANSIQFLVNNGTNPFNGEKILNPSSARRLKALMLTTGLYNESGEFAFRVGMPGKSGVGGGIVALIPNMLGIAVWSPPLNSFGNSVVALEALERFTTYLDKSVF